MFFVTHVTVHKYHAQLKGYLLHLLTKTKHNDNQENYSHTHKL